LHTLLLGVIPLESIVLTSPLVNVDGAVSLMSAIRRPKLVAPALS
jgi:hypothetical protein